MDSLTPMVDYLDGTRNALGTFLLPGYFYDLGGSHAVMDVQPQGWAWVQVKVWNFTLGATYEEVAARSLGGYGQSDPFYAQGGNPFDLLHLPAPLTGLQSFSVLQVVPEPALGWLLLAGLPALWWRGRRAGRAR